jgi:hypothetical protein
VKEANDPASILKTKTLVACSGAPSRGKGDDETDNKIAAKGMIQMIDTLGRAAKISAILATALTIATGALAQVPTDAQRAAIKSQCRSDYMAHCSSIPPGGKASLQCLQQNMASLAPGCQSAVSAVSAPSEAKTEPKAETETKAEPPADNKAQPAPAATTAEPPAASASKAAATPAKKPSSAQISAIRRACRSDYMNVCAGVPTGGAAALQCLAKNKSKVSAACQRAVAVVSGGAAAPAGGAAPNEANANPAPAAGAPAAPAMVLRPMRPREVLFVMRSACGADVRALCRGIDPGGGRIVQCLEANASSLSPECRGVLSRFAAQ